MLHDHILDATYRPLFDFHPCFPCGLILSPSLVLAFWVARSHGRVLSVGSCAPGLGSQIGVEASDELLPALLVLGPPSNLECVLPVEPIVEINKESDECQHLRLGQRRVTNKNVVDADVAVQDATAERLPVP